MCVCVLVSHLREGHFVVLVLGECCCVVPVHLKYLKLGYILLVLNVFAAEFLRTFL